MLGGSSIWSLTRRTAGYSSSAKGDDLQRGESEGGQIGDLFVPQMGMIMMTVTNVEHETDHPRTGAPNGMTGLEFIPKRMQKLLWKCGNCPRRRARRAMPSARSSWR
jgi:hypothetical protein